MCAVIAEVGSCASSLTVCLPIETYVAANVGKQTVKGAVECKLVSNCSTESMLTDVTWLVKMCYNTVTEEMCC